MTRFEGLCQSYKISQQKYREYEKACEGFIQELYGGFITYAEIPRGQVRLIPLHKEATKGSLYSAMGAMNLENDTYFHLGLELTVYLAPKTFPQQGLLLHLRIKQNKEGFVVKITSDDEPTCVRAGNQQDLEGIYNKILDLITDHFENGLQKFLDGTPDPIARIGFSVNE